MIISPRIGTHLNLLRATTNIDWSISITISIRSTPMARRCYCVSTPWVVVRRQVRHLPGSLPRWANPIDTTVTPGVTYSFFDEKDQIWRLIPVFWNTTYLAKKKALIAMAGAGITANSQFNSQVQVFVIGDANAITEDWNIPNDAYGSPSEVELWLNDPVTGNPPGAGYTTQKMIDAAIHQGDATFADGVISGAGTTLTSASAVFTQADVKHRIRGTGFRDRTKITAWSARTQVTLSQPARRNAHSFTIVGRRDGLIDVAMAAFPESIRRHRGERQRP